MHNHNKGVPTGMIAPGLILGFLAGLSAGAILGVLFAPKKGEETRRELRDKAMAARDRMQQQIAVQKNKIKRTAQTAKESAEEGGEGSPLPR